MGDMFYFRSPTRPLSPKYRLDLRHKLKICKCRRCAKMDDQMQRACVARLDEPVFCANSLSSVISHHGFGGCITDRSAPVASNTAQRQGYDGNTTDANDSDNLPATFDQVDEISQQRLFPEDIHHSRPHALNTPHEESETRTQLALEDTVQSTLFIPRLLRLLGLEQNWSPESENDNLTTQLPTASLPRSTYITPVIEGFATYIYETDDEALAVDDPRRSYDFKDFMHSWHHNEDVSDDQRDPELNLCSFLHADRDVVDQTDVISGDMDIQGLHWDKVKLRRNQVVESRKLHHPSKHTLISYPEPTTMELKDVSAMSTTAERQYRFKTFTSQHHARYSHYQLRNVLAATSRNEIFYATGSKVLKTVLGSPTMRTTAMDLTKNSPSHSQIRITCLSASAKLQDGSYRSDHVLLAGGFGGEYALLDITAEGNSRVHSGFVNHDYNGLVTHVDSYTDRSSGHLRACFCSNDRKVRIMDIITKNFINTFAYENAANCSALSSDGRLRVFVGDCNETLITDADRGDILVAMKEHRDHGFACAWSENGRHVATGAQDGLVVLWDARNWSLPLRTMHCGMATARSLHFTSDGALVVGEDDDLITIYDTRRNDEKQEIRFFGSIAGIALIDGGEELVVANSDATIGGLLSFQRKPQSPWGGRYDEPTPRYSISGGERSRYRRAVVRDFMCQESESGYGIVV